MDDAGEGAFLGVGGEDGVALDGGGVCGGVGDGIELAAEVCVAVFVEGDGAVAGFGVDFDVGVWQGFSGGGVRD